jgi:hypothetical protein
MTQFSEFLLFSNRKGRRTAAVVLGAAALTLIAGCSAGTSGSSRSPGSAAKPTSREAIRLAAYETQRVNSLAATISEQIAGQGITNGTLEYQLKPTLLAGATLSFDGQSLTMIMSDKAVWFKPPAGQAGLGGKSWVEVRFSDMTGTMGTVLRNLVASAHNENPAEQTQTFTASKNVHEVGTQVINGVQTIHYAGTITAAAALRALPLAARKALAPVLNLVTGDIHFDVWVDARHVVRRVVEVETIGGQSVTVTVDVTAVNQPVPVAPPPASQVTILPASVLSGL